MPIHDNLQDSHADCVSRCSLVQHIFDFSVQVASYAQCIAIPISGQEAGHPVIRNMHAISALIHEDGISIQNVRQP